jgi:cysteinyl-tRNA synthetase
LPLKKGLKRLFEAIKTLEKITPEDKSTVIVGDIIFKAYSAIKDDLNSPIAIGQLFEAVKIINAAFDKKESLDIKDIEELKSFFKTFVFDILGLKDDELMVKDEISDKLINTMLEIRQEAKEKKDFATSDRIRDELIKLGIEIKDRKDGFDWKYSNS